VFGDNRACASGDEGGGRRDVECSGAVAAGAACVEQRRVAMPVMISSIASAAWSSLRSWPRTI